MARQDIYELPVRTIREMIANAVCHRSYLSPGKIQVALFDDRLEVTSPGMLDNDITIEKMKTGLSKIRNKGIAAAFSYMNVIEAWGSGIPRMFQDAMEYGLREPELIDMGSDFRVNLYRAETKVDQFGVIEPGNCNFGANGANGANFGANGAKVGTDEDVILNLLRQNSKIRQKELHEETGIPIRTVKRIMAVLQQKGKVERQGSNRSGEWIVK